MHDDRQSGARDSFINSLAVYRGAHVSLVNKYAEARIIHRGSKWRVLWNLFNPPGALALSHTNAQNCNRSLYPGDSCKRKRSLAGILKRGIRRNFIFGSAWIFSLFLFFPVLLSLFSFLLSPLSFFFFHVSFDLFLPFVRSTHRAQRNYPSGFRTRLNEYGN